MGINADYIIKSVDTDRASLLKDETIFVQANGSLGSKNHFVEGYGTNDVAVTLMNGFYNTYPFKYEENYSQFPQEGQTIVNLPSVTSVLFKFNGHNVNLTEMILVDVNRTFDLTSGLVKRIANYKKDLLEVIIVEEKLVSYDKDLIAYRLSFSANQKGKLDINSKLSMPNVVSNEAYDPRVGIVKKHLDLKSIQLSADDACMVVETINTNKALAVYMTHDIDLNYQSNENGVDSTTSIDYESGYFVFHKYGLYQRLVNTTDLFDKNMNETFESILEKEKERLKAFWAISNIGVSNSILDQTLKYNAYMLYHHSPSDGYRSIAAKGISGEGYEGHYFWDTETYMLPYFILTHKEKAKALLMFRYHTLDEARLEAKNLGATRGAKIPWRTISGVESSPYYPAGSAQIHINSDVALAFINYYYATKDDDFMLRYGVELLLETAIFYLEYGHFKNDSFHLYSVTGPDEYTAIVNDNYYTNKLAKTHMSFIFNYIKKHEKTCAAILDKLNINEHDLETLNKASKQMSLLKDDKLGILKQDDSFLNKKELPIDSIDKSKLPLLLHYHPLYIYRHQILKQADTVLAMVLVDDIDKITYEKTVDYYLARTTHDSSLSKCAYGIAKYRLGKSAIANEYFMSIALLDFKDLKNHTRHGLHMANAGGSYLMMTLGLLGMVFGEKLILRPAKQKEIDSYELTFTYQNVLIHVSYQKNTFSITTSGPLDIIYYDEALHVEHQLNLGVR